jgi:predicted subunit of tRNA(5-methylaminomethyl-2-thiouridylate) methyltransferase
MTKAKKEPFLSDSRLHDIWNVRPIDHAEGELKDFDRLICSAVARCLNESKEPRSELADTLSFVLGERVSAAMLDAYSSGARRDYKVPASRFIVLMAITRRFDLLDAVLREVGGKALNAKDSKVFEIGKRYVESLNAARALDDLVSKTLGPRSD